MALGHAVSFSQSATNSEGEVYQPYSIDKREIELGRDFLPEPVLNNLLGMKLGESKNYSLVLPEDSYPEEWRGKEIKGELTIHSLAEVVLPPLDDELAKDEAFENIDEMKEFFKSSLDFEAKRYRQNVAENASLEALANAVDLAVPPYFTDQVIDQMIDGMRLPKAEVSQLIGNKEVRNSLLPNAKIRAKNTLLLWEIVKKFDLKIEDEDIDQKIDQMLPPSKSGEEQEDLKKTLKASLKSSSKDNLLIEKALKFLTQNVDFSWTPSTSA